MTKQSYISNENNNNNEQQQQNEPQNRMQLSQSYLNYKANPIELTWKKLSIVATIPDPENSKKTIEKVIINNSEGIFRPGQFTAIQGPSGSGKTTLLDFLSGRLVSKNLTITGELYLNGQRINDINKYSSQIAYVLQDDILLGTQTPKEAFMFVANMRLPNLTAEEKREKVDDLIKVLGLKDCENTRIGDELTKGISGGQRKRTSIGVELLTNPSMLFLDEPTTGLDSSTAQQLIQFLNYLSKSKGVTIVSTIHQPSSETFIEFENLLLVCRGNVLYQGDAQIAINYFEKAGFQIPLYSNPSEVFMNLMNEEGLMIEKMKKNEQLPSDEIIHKEFEERLEKMISDYKNSEMFQKLDMREKSVVPKKHEYHLNSLYQFGYLWQRSFVSQLRNNLDFKLKILEGIVLAGACIIVFNDLGDRNYEAIQNRTGVLSYLTGEVIFSALLGSISTFCIDKVLFMKERKNNTYGAGPYFWGKSLADQPLHIVYALITIIFIYHAMGLNTDEPEKFPINLLIFILSYWAASGFGLLVSVIVPNLEMAMALIPIIIIPFMNQNGYYINVNSTPFILKWIDAISMFRWSFQASTINEFEGKEIQCDCLPYDPTDSQYLALQKETNSPDGTCIPVQCDALEQYGWSETLSESMWILFILGITTRIIGFIGMYLLSRPKIPVLKSPEESKNTEMKQKI